MSTATPFFRQVRMRRSTGASGLQAFRWAAGLLWRDFLGSLQAPAPSTPPTDPRRRARLDRRADVERRARQRLKLVQ